MEEDCGGPQLRIIFIFGSLRTVCGPPGDHQEIVSCPILIACPPFNGRTRSSFACTRISLTVAGLVPGLQYKHLTVLLKAAVNGGPAARLAALEDFARSTYLDWSLRAATS